MRIKSIKIKENVSGWELKKVNFKELSLIVGISGVGKTKILRSINNLKNIASGSNGIEGLEWELVFSINDNEYIWFGEYKNNQKIVGDEIVISDLQHDLMINEFENEELTKDGKRIFKRDRENIEFFGKAMPLMNPEKSLLNLFSRENEIKSILSALNKISVINSSFETTLMLETTKNNDKLPNFDGLIKSIDIIREIQIPVIHKLYLVSKNAPDKFEIIKEKYKEVFPHVEDIRFKEFSFGNILATTLQIKEKGSKWITQDIVSSGMLKTLIYISGVILGPKDGVVLIDEFENSLGINCIDILDDEILDNTNNIQFIITSHHPYIINTIEMDNWIILSRKNNEVYSNTADELRLGNSKHEAFKQLINTINNLGG